RRPRPGARPGASARGSRNRAARRRGGLSRPPGAGRTGRATPGTPSAAASGPGLPRVLAAAVRQGVRAPGVLRLLAARALGALAGLRLLVGPEVERRVEFLLGHVLILRRRRGGSPGW